MTQGAISKSGWDFLYISWRLVQKAWTNQPQDHEIDKLQALVQKARPTIIVELGTRFGGTALALHDACPDACLFSVDQQNTPETEDVVRNLGDAGSEYGKHPEYFPRRSWFPKHVRFIRGDFLHDTEMVKNLVDDIRDSSEEYQRLLLFVDGYDKIAESKAYYKWLLPGDILAVNNTDQWDMADMETAIEVPKEYERFEFEWSEKVGLILTRAWRRK